VLCVDLIARPGQPAPYLQFPGAEFEIIILSIDPDWEPDPDAEPGKVPYLTPPDLTYQLDGLSREAVAEIVELMIDRICEGLSPDSDLRGFWTDALDATVRHYKEGRHGPAAEA